jgi:hypothetical protein
MDEECTLEVADDTGRYDENSESDTDLPSGQKDKSHEAGGSGHNPLPVPPAKKISPKKMTDQTFAMREILTQPGHLTCTVQKISHENKTLAANHTQQFAEFQVMKRTFSTAMATVNPAAIPAAANAMPNNIPLAHHLGLPFPA